MVKIVSTSFRQTIKARKTTKNVVFFQNTNLLCDLVSVVDDRLQDVRQALDLLPQVLHVSRLVGDKVPDVKDTHTGYLNYFSHGIEFQSQILSMQNIM